jgi:hypothetical protein
MIEKFLNSSWSSRKLHFSLFVIVMVSWMLSRKLIDSGIYGDIVKTVVLCYLAANAAQKFVPPPKPTPKVED